MLTVAILAGGLGSRLYPITEKIPKALVDVVGKPFIVRQLSYLRDQGITHAVVCIGNRGEMIQDVVGNGENFGIKVSYSSDGPNLLGTGGALRRAIHLLGDEFFVLYGDSFLPINFNDVQLAFRKSAQLALMTVFENNDKLDRSNVLFKADRILEYNKFQQRCNMRHIDYGLGIISSAVLKRYPINVYFDLADIYYQLSINGELAGFEVRERFYEIGSHSGLKELNKYFSSTEDR